MEPDKLFKSTIAYYKIVTAFSAVMCFVLFFYKSFDPVRGLEQMIVNDLYGTKVMPAEARPIFEFVFLLFDLLSFLTLALQYMVIHFALQKREKWAYYSMFLIGLGWPIAAALISLQCGTNSYFISVGMMTVLFLPPLVVLKKYFI